MTVFSVLWKSALASGISLYLLRCWIVSRWGRFTKQVDCSKMVVVITGATSGIGKATAENLAARGATVVLACRNIDLAKKMADDLCKAHENARVIALKLDLSNFDSVDIFCRQARAVLSKIDVLILNAGVAFCPYSLTSQGLELQMGVNHFGHARLTIGLLALLKKSPSPRVVQLSSTLYKNSKLPERLPKIHGEARIEDLCFSKSDYNKRVAYADSKLAGMLFAKEMSRKYKAIKWLSVSPGIVYTNLGRHSSMLVKVLFAPFYLLFMLVAVRSPEEGCQTVLYAALDDQIKEVYGFYRDCQPAQVSTLLVNTQLSEKLYDATIEIIHRCDDNDD